MGPVELAGLAIVIVGFGVAASIEIEVYIFACLIYLHTMHFLVIFSV